MFVSVIMPVYNAGPYLAEAVESVLGQTHPDFEFIAVDDGSTDGSRDILDRYAARDPRMRVLHQANAGGAAARNRALEEARAEWVISIDHDDVMLPDRIERQLAFLEAHPDVKVFASRAYYINRSGRVIGTTVLEPLTTREAFERYVAHGGVIGLNHPSVALHRRTVLDVGGYRSAFAGAEDIDLWNRVAEAGHLVLQQKEVLTKYRIHETSVMNARVRQSWEVAEWAIACMHARRAGEPEPSREAFMHARRAQPWRRRINQESLMLARIFYRGAGFDIANGHWLRGGARLVVAGLARPGYVLSRLASQMPLPGRIRGAGTAA